MITFKIGQIIKIKSLSWFNTAKDVRTGWVKRNGECFTEMMANQLCDKQFTIENIIDDKFYVINGNQLIFEYAVDIIESAILNNIHIPVIVKGNFLGYDESDDRTVTEITLLVIYKLNNGFPVNAYPIDESDKIPTSTKRRGRPKGSTTKSKSDIKLKSNTTSPKNKLSKGELVIYWTKPSRADFSLGLYYGTENKIIKVIVDGEIKSVAGVMKYTKDEFIKLQEFSIHHFRNLDKDVEELNKKIKDLIKDFEINHKVMLSAFSDLIIIH